MFRIRRQFLTLPIVAGALCSSALASPLAKDARVDRIVVYKAKRELELWGNGKLLKTYKVALGNQAVGHKEREGDGRTPEGSYIIDSRNAASRYHKSLPVSYPNAQDRERAKKLSVSPGGAIMIHGLPNGWGWTGAGHRAVDWTAGCIAVTNEELEEIWRAVPDGTPIEIKP